MNNLADTYRSLGRYREGAQLNEDALALGKARLAPDHPETLRGMNYLASNYDGLGRHEDALTLREESLRRHRGTFGPLHSDTLSCMRQYAWSLVKVGRGAEAVPIIDECIKGASGADVYPSVVTNALYLRLRYFAKGNNATGCLETARMWDDVGRTDASGLYDRACAHAVTAAVISVRHPHSPRRTHPTSRTKPPSERRRSGLTDGTRCDGFGFRPGGTVARSQG